MAQPRVDNRRGRRTPAKDVKKSGRLRPPTPCLNCGLMGDRSRGLCRLCYGSEKIRSTFPPVKKSIEIADFNGRAPLPEPTEARAGTPEKVAVMERRAALGQQLFHPSDAREMSDAEERMMRLAEMFSASIEETDSLEELLS